MMKTLLLLLLILAAAYLYAAINLRMSYRKLL